jgi:23S rRNA pseudouridine955/2504/2580 synthase/23S rRNA pseudouridine1911/1915/1917 synthase
MEPLIDSNYEIIADSDKFIAVNKSGDCPTHEGGLYKENCLTRLLEKKFKKRFHPVYRLDRETSGIVIFAKESKYVNEIKLEDKEYVAIVEGRIDQEIKVDKPIGEVKGEHINWKKGVVAGAKDAITKIFPIKFNENFSLVKIIPLTGRQHQIRVHMQHIKHPIMDDKVYGKSDKLFKEYLEGKKVDGLMQRQALHMSKINVDGLMIESPMPQDMKKAVDFLF